MGVESSLVPSLRAALEGRWKDVNWSAIKSVCQSTRAGLDNLPGSENHGVLAWLTALVVAWKRPEHLQRLNLTRSEVVAWWSREMTDRLRKDLQLTEARSRIYAIWGAVLICWLRRAFQTFPDLADLHLRYVRATAGFVALCGFPVRPTGYDPPVQAKLFKQKVFVPLAGARSWSADKVDGVLHAHHMGQSAWEVFACGLLDIPVPEEFQWERAVIAAAQPGWMGLSSAEVSHFRVAIRGDLVVLDEIMAWLDGVGSLWPCRLVRFERGSACIGLGRGINGNTAAIYTMAVHEDGNIHFLAVNPGNRHQADPEPCGVNEFDHGHGRVKYVTWAGGEDWPRKELVLYPDRWGRVVWDVHLQRDGEHVVRRPGVPVPVPPPIDPGPPPGEDDDRRDIWQRIIDFLLFWRR